MSKTSAAAKLALKSSSRYLKSGKKDSIGLRPGIIKWEGDDVSFLIKGAAPKAVTKELGYFGATRSERIEELENAVGKATAAAFAPTCVKDGAQLPANMCDPSLNDKLATAAKALKAEQSGAGAPPPGEAWLPPAKKPTNTLMLVVVASIIAVGAYLYFNR